MAGTVIVEPIVNRWGFRVAVYVLCAIQIVGCVCKFDKYTSKYILIESGLTMPSGDGHSSMGGIHNRPSPAVCHCRYPGECRYVG